MRDSKYQLERPGNEGPDAQWAYWQALSQPRRIEPGLALSSNHLLRSVAWSKLISNWVSPLSGTLGYPVLMWAGFKQHMRGIDQWIGEPEPVIVCGIDLCVQTFAKLTEVTSSCRYAGMPN
jgi:hypothetical protein